MSVSCLGRTTFTDKRSGKTITLRIVKDTEWDEYAVEWVEDGKADYDRTYFTDDLQDAKDTMDAVARSCQ